MFKFILYISSIFFTIFASSSEALSPIKKCLTEDEIVQQLPQLRERFSESAVLRIKSEDDFLKFSYRTLTPILKGQVPEKGKLNGDLCNKEVFVGDVILVFGSISQFGFDVGYSIKLYSEQWDLVWSEPALDWIRQEYGSET